MGRRCYPVYLSKDDEEPIFIVCEEDYPENTLYKKFQFHAWG